jgi:hypothetical protein
MLATATAYIAAACGLLNNAKYPSAPNYDPGTLLVIWIECR